MPPKDRKTDQKPDVRKERRYLKTRLTDQEILTAARLASDKNTEIRSLREDLVRVRSDFKARIDGAISTMNCESEKVKTGCEFRYVTCSMIMDDPEPGKKRIVRDDDGTQVAIEDMMMDEMQRSLPLDPPEPPQ